MDVAGRKRIEEILGRAEEAGRGALLEDEVYEVLREIGITTPRFLTVRTGAGSKDLGAEAESIASRFCGAEVVLKILSPDILHKTEAGGIAFTKGGPEILRAEMRALLERVRARAPQARLEGILACEKVDYRANLPGVEALLGLRQDSAFGPVVVIGVGGLLTEWLGELAPGSTTWAISARDPILGSDAPPDLGRLGPAFQLLFQSSRLHKAPPLDPGRFWPTLRAWADLAATFGNDTSGSGFVLDEMEVNPLAVTADRSTVALDGVARFSRGRPRVRMRSIARVRNLLEPRSVAVVGASAKAINPGRIILRNLKRAEGIDYGKVYPIHPHEKSIDSIPCVPNVDSLKETVDLAVISIPAEGARDSIREFVEKEKAQSIILIPGGFGETGQHHLEQETIDAIDRGHARPGGGPVVVGGNCLGIVSKKRYNTFFLPNYKLPFSDAPGDNLVAISQSGAYLVTLASNLDGMIFPKASVSYGNQIDLTVADFLEYYLDDPLVQVVACYIEGFKPLDGQRFIDLARKHRAMDRTVIVFKAGKTPLGAKAAASHTASLAGDYAVARSLMRDAGVLVAQTLNQFEDFVKAFTMLYDRVPKGTRVAMISNAGFECSAAMDALYGMDLAAFSGETKARLRSVLPEIAHPDNPIDATPMATTQQFIAAVEAFLSDPGVDAAVVSVVPPTPALDNLPPDLAEAHAENIYSPSSLPKQLIRVVQQSPKPIVVSVDSGRIYDASVIMLQRAGIPAYRKIDRAMRAIAVYCRSRSA